MNAGKSTAIVQVAYNYEERGQNVLIAKPSIDTKGEGIVSRLGVERDIDFAITPDMDVHQFFLNHVATATDGREVVDCLIIDEAQFLNESQVNQLFIIAVKENVPVIAYGLRGDFRTNSFEGSRRLLEIAHSLEEMKTICRCGKKAIFNGRKIDGEFVQNGSQVAIDGKQADYESLCGNCYLTKVGNFS